MHLCFMQRMTPKQSSILATISRLELQNDNNCVYIYIYNMYFNECTTS